MPALSSVDTGKKLRIIYVQLFLQICSTGFLPFIPLIAYIILGLFGRCFESKICLQRRYSLLDATQDLEGNWRFRCISEGFTVFAGCLTEKGEISLKTECSAKEYVLSHLTEGIQLWGIVNNAGIFSCFGPDDWTTIDDYVKAVEVNTFGVIRITQAFKKLVKHSQGRIVTVTSVNGRLSTPAAGPYVVSKFGTEAYMDSIRQEVYGFGVKVCILEPGAFRTALLDKQAMIDRIEKQKVVGQMCLGGVVVVARVPGMDETQVWSKLDSETKEEYGEKYKDYFIKWWNELFWLFELTEHTLCPSTTTFMHLQQNIPDIATTVDGMRFWCTFRYHCCRRGGPILCSGASAIKGCKLLPRSD
ncbi:Protein CBR-dhs-20 [Parelaphostrongylus tenuis]|uniref:Protein CBR-dhs-20 n=1 Tax=Parelaphostrongylus tenuis TaxID=148309 RepID=A0AAD5WEW4_PARTN|nr:Protein CBR-dhs-20 [Parelaphostrongylus tenuis]